MKRTVLLICLSVVLIAALLLVGGALGCAPPAEEKEPVVVGFIGDLSADWGLSGVRSMQIAVDEINAAGGILGGRQLKLVQGDTRSDPTEAIKAYDYLNEVEHCDFIISSDIDDCALAWLPRVAEYKTPTMDTWTSAIGMIEKVRDDYENYKSYFMFNVCDYMMGYGMIDFSQTLKDQMGWNTCVLFQEDTAYAAGVADFVEAELLPAVGITILDKIVYDVNTVDFAPIYDEIEALNPDFIYTISSVNSIIPCAQYVELEIPIPMTGLNSAAIGEDFWDDVGGKGAGISSFCPPPGLGLSMELDARTQAYVDKYQARYTTRPVYPHFNGITSYYGVYIMAEAAERAGGFTPLDAWVEEMLNTDFKVYKGSELFFRWRFYRPGVVEPITDMTWPHDVVFDPTGEEGVPGMMGIQWYEGGIVKCIYPPKYATGNFTNPPWIP
jgi:branched-chain amino acid transport system substrate-binding protein